MRCSCWCWPGISWPRTGRSAASCAMRGCAPPATRPARPPRPPNWPDEPAPMNPVRRNRLLLILALLAAAGIAAALVTWAIQRNITYLYTPSEVLRGEAGKHARFRLGGMVAADSFARAPGSLEAHFRVTDGDAQMPVVYNGILPDLFREKQAVIATGRMQGDRFVAEQVLAKHDETYMPKEVADKMGIAHKKHDVAPTAGAAPAESK